MLVAMTDNQYFMLDSSYSRDKLKQLKMQHTFYCPQCNEEVLLKIGQVMSPHFAHRANSHCDRAFSEGETEDHLKGKIALYYFLKNYSNHVKLEPTFRALFQRPDIYIEKNQKSYAVEFQCSTISTELLQKRTRTYCQHDIHPIWIYRTKDEWITCVQQITTLSINRFLQQFIQPNESPYILSYQPQSKLFLYISPIMHVHQNQYIVKLSKLPLEKQCFPMLVPKKVSYEEYEKMYRLYEENKKHYVLRKMRTSKLGVQDRLLRALYELRLEKDRLPCFLGVPSKNAAALKVHAIEWQAALFYYMHLHEMEMHHWNMHTINHFLQWTKLTADREGVTAIVHYIRLLKHFHIRTLNDRAEAMQIMKFLYAR